MLGMWRRENFAATFWIVKDPALRERSKLDLIFRQETCKISKGYDFLNP